MMMHHLPAPCFHIVGQSEVTQRFFIDERSRGGGIRITDAFSKLLESGQSPQQARLEHLLAECSTA